MDDMLLQIVGNGLFLFKEERKHAPKKTKKRRREEVLPIWNLHKNQLAKEEDCLTVSVCMVYLCPSMARFLLGLA